MCVGLLLYIYIYIYNKPLNWDSVNCNKRLLFPTPMKTQLYINIRIT